MVDVSPLDVRPLDAGDFTACARLSCQVFGFQPVEAIPDWAMFTTTRHGGVALGAFAEGRLVGYSYAFPGYDGRPFLYSCGLAVLQDWRSHGIGLALKRAQREAAISLGYREIRWTTDALSSPALYLYLTRLGAVITAFHTDLYEPFRPGTHVDEVEISWALDRRPTAPARRAPVEIARVEIPWNITLLRREQPEQAARWRTAVRGRMPRLLRSGFQGVSVLVSRDRNRSFVVFERSTVTSPHA